MIERYEYSMRSDPLYEEINFVCDNSHDVFLSMSEVNLIFMTISIIFCNL